VHSYPQSNVFNDETDDDTNARRLRATRSLWDPDYVDESWIGEPIRFLPRMHDTIDETYPDTPLFISEWNFGAEETMNGALAIADALGIYGREGVYAATYWRSPEAGSPGAFAFTMHGNFDGDGSAFEGSVIPVTIDGTDGLVTAYAALDVSAGMLRVMILNEDPDSPVSATLNIVGLDPTESAARYTYGPSDLTSIVADTVAMGSAIELAPYTITVLEIPT